MTADKPFAKSPKQTDAPTVRAPKPSNTNFMETLVTWTFKVVGFPFWAVTTIINQMLTPGAAGATFLGHCVFIFLTILSSDSYWQILFQGSPLFPWYEQDWTGWGWLPRLSFFPLGLSLGLLANPTFYLCAAIGLGIQNIQSAFVTGEKFASINPRMIGFLAIITWTFDIFLTFSSRSPFRYEEPGMVFGCVLFNIFTIICAELGRWIEKILSNTK